MSFAAEVPPTDAAPKGEASTLEEYQNPAIPATIARVRRGILTAPSAVVPMLPATRVHAQPEPIRNTSPVKRVR